jgi:hypothetical protein
VLVELEHHHDDDQGQNGRANPGVKRIGICLSLKEGGCGGSTAGGSVLCTPKKAERRKLAMESSDLTLDPPDLCLLIVLFEWEDKRTLKRRRSGSRPDKRPD